MSQQENPFASPDGKRPTCLEMLQVILDGDASKDQQEYFASHMEECMPCYKNHQLDLQIRALIKSKCCGGNVPADLIDKIKSQVNSVS
ncbi:MAG: anti-sigma factor [Cyclobacteriaceae bacterium]